MPWLPQFDLLNWDMQIYKQQRSLKMLLRGSFSETSRKRTIFLHT